VTSRLILAYVERESGRKGVQEVLAQAGLAEREAELRDENSWLSFEEKIRLWDAAVAVTGDPAVALRVGECALDFSVALTLKRALHALGSPDFVFRNVARANSKFNWAHSLEITERERGRASLRYQDISGVGYHHYDCDYTIGLLSTVPRLFGLPAARVSHPVCGARDGDCCLFDVQWSADTRHVNRISLAGAVSGVLMAGIGAFLDPVVSAAGGGVVVLSAGVAAVRTYRFMHRRIWALEARVRDQDETAEAQLSSLATLSSDLRLDEVLGRIMASASSAVGGAEFALLIAEAARMRADRHSGLPADALHSLEQWAQAEHKTISAGPLVIDDLSTAPSLARLARASDVPLGSACAVPLVLGERLLGVLIALAPGAGVFLAPDIRALETYGQHAAIALSNARLVDQLERQAAEDPLTGLANKRALQLACEAEISRAGRESSSLALVVLDLDHFKLINDRHGHPYGDEVLVAVAEALRTAVRGHDTVARFGGEEFVILLPRATAEEARTVADRARALIAEIDLPEGRLSSSAGAVATGGGAAPRWGELFDAADRALYQAKRLGRGRTELAPVLESLRVASAS
jgi:diguanylate cyclase (GGDEF)-like protein